MTDVALSLSAAVAAAPPPALAELPPQPRTLQETGLEQQLVVELIGKALYLGGKTHLPVLTTRLRLSLNVLREVLEFMLAEQVAEVSWRGDSDIDVQYQLTSAGKLRAAAWLERSPYVGPAPVTLAAYRAVVEAQAAQMALPQAADLAAEFADDVLAPAMQDRLGAAMYAGRSILLYGPPGSGKSTLARRLGRLLPGLVAVPCALLAGQDIITVYDPAVHLPPAPRQLAGQTRRSADIRWMLCQRPLVALGAELDAAMLELQPDAASGCHQAPPQLKANHGLLLLDDLGRQRLPAPVLLQRLAAPLTQNSDLLATAGGSKLVVPFRLQLVLATSLAPAALFDAPALRRLAYRIEVGALSAEAYRNLLRQQCRAAGVVYDEAAQQHLVGQLHGGSGQPLLASYPRELVERIVDFAGYAGEPARLTVATLEQAWISLFAGCERAA